MLSFTQLLLEQPNPTGDEPGPAEAYLSIPTCKVHLLLPLQRESAHRERSKQRAGAVWAIGAAGVGAGLPEHSFFSSQLHSHHQWAGSSAFSPFPPPTPFASAEELQEQKVKIDLPPLFLFLVFWHPPLAAPPSRSRPPPAPTLQGRTPPMGAISSIPAQGGGGRNPGGSGLPSPAPTARAPSSIPSVPPTLWKHPQLCSSFSPVQCRCMGDLYSSIVIFFYICFFFFCFALCSSLSNP